MIDQGIVSGGTFLANILLARYLSAHDYGVYVLLMGGMLTLQLVNATMLFHPLSVSLVLASEADRPRLLKTALVLVVVASSALSAGLAVVLAALGYAALVLPAVCCFLSWQVQEGMRRGLLAAFRHRAATLGDAVSYLGQSAIVIGLVAFDVLTPAHALYGLAGTCCVAAVLQGRQLGLRFRTKLILRRTVATFWSVGGAWSLGNGLLSNARLQVLPWALAVGAGPAAAAGFQAALNIVNLSNPFVMGLCNIIPQAAAQASNQGAAKAWRDVRVYFLVAVPPLLAFALLVLVVPEQLLLLVYGSSSAYLGAALSVRLLVVAAMAGYFTDMVVAFLHGMRAVPLAFAVNAAGAVGATVLVAVLVAPLGIIGSCLALIGANIARLIVVYAILSRMVAGEGSRPTRLQEIEP
ncbi:O-antigen/teichoic acid export membrane protein [Humitalea rosea]|uniref:O-antigen/teichoic acid export membrane protein n=1 Tax=Humitalea rosea TaxID=990373 RepID=A0A2W7I0A2_9PROT|nr:hypothetical protein [Humitalea rosea]PZW38685.1 O-antigen/teichoic acid export membrane protein [Humitalea rosea]